jgi:hypothetical protein
MQRVQKIADVKPVFLRKRPPDLVVTAIGEVPTQGWSGTQLLPRCYLLPPADGIWEYDLIAQPPEGPAAEQVSQVEATHKWSNFALKGIIVGVRVYGVGRGVKECRFADVSITSRSQKRCLVIAPRFPSKDQRTLVRIVPVDAPYEAVYRPVFGPAEKNECAAWLKGLDPTVMGDDMPFPLSL